MRDGGSVWVFTTYYVYSWALGLICQTSTDLWHLRILGRKGNVLSNLTLVLRLLQHQLLILLLRGQELRRHLMERLSYEWRLLLGVLELLVIILLLKLLKQICLVHLKLLYRLLDFLVHHIDIWLLNCWALRRLLRRLARLYLRLLLELRLLLRVQLLDLSRLHLLLIASPVTSCTRQITRNISIHHLRHAGDLLLELRRRMSNHHRVHTLLFVVMQHSERRWPWSVHIKMRLPLNHLTLVSLGLQRVFLRHLASNCAILRLPFFLSLCTHLLLM